MTSEQIIQPNEPTAEARKSAESIVNKWHDQQCFDGVTFLPAIDKSLLIKLIAAALAERDGRIERLESRIRDEHSTFQFGAEVMNKLVIPRAKQMLDGEIAINALNRWMFELDEAQDKVSKLEGYLERANWRRCNIPACNCGGYHNWNPHSWEGSIIDRLNELARENAKDFHEVKDGAEAADLIVQIHGAYNNISSVRADRDTLRAEVER